MLLVLELGFLMMVVLEAQPRRSPGGLPSFLDVLVLDKKRGPSDWMVPCALLVMGSDQHQTDHADYAKQNGNDRL